MHRTYGREPGSNIRQHEQRRVHGAYSLEIIDKRWLRAALPVLLGDVLPRSLAIKEVLLADAIGRAKPRECLHHFVTGDFAALTQVHVKAIHLRKCAAIAPTGMGFN